MPHLGSRRGATLIDLVIGLAILSLLFAGIFLVYFSILDATANVEIRGSAAAVLNKQVEIIRNLPYDKVGTTGGVPSGVIPQEQTVVQADTEFVLKTTIRNIDDPFDGTLGGSPNDNAPADYKLVTLEVSCPKCARFLPLAFTTTVAPKNLETASSTGSLFVNVFDAAGQPVSGATVHISNSSITPTIDLTDITNTNGLLQLVGIPSSTQKYHIEVSKMGYSSDRTYPPGGVGNPNPTLPDVTVAVQSVSNASFAIDRTSQVTFTTSDYYCTAIPNKTFSMAGNKMIGASVLKFSTSSQTDGSGNKVFGSLEWDTYTITSTASGYTLAGTIPLAPLTINPNSTLDFRFVLVPTVSGGLMVTVTDASGQGVNDAEVTVARPGFSETRTTGHLSVTKTDWSGGAYDSKSNIDPNTPGSLTLLTNASGTYPSGDEWLISNTLDFGGASTTLFNVSWNGSEPVPAGSESIKFQLAGNTDNATWNFVGPDGTSGTYFTDASFTPPSSVNGNRYYRYKVFLSTLNENVSPRLDDISFEFRSTCVPPYQTLFSSLSSATYTVTVNAAGFGEATTSVAVGAGTEEVIVQLIP